MTLGILKETKDGESRVMLTPIEVREIVGHGYRVIVQRDCGMASGFDDGAYAASGAEIKLDKREIFSESDIVVKVKELTGEECGLLREGQIILACLHPAANPELVDALISSKCIAFTAEDCHRYGSPNCEAAGRLGAFFGIESMLTVNGGKGKIPGGIAGAPSMRVLILGGGLVGASALSVMYSLGAHCTVADIRLDTLRSLLWRYNNRIDTAFCTRETIASLLPNTDMVINCVKWQKERRDFLIDRQMLSLMEKGSVIVDISNDSPGAIETSRETSHSEPRYTVDGIVHYCVANIPGAAARTTSVAYSAEMLPIIMNILKNGVDKACISDGYIRRSLTAYRGYLTHEETSAVQRRPWIRPEDILGISNSVLDFAPSTTETRSDLFYSKNGLYRE